MTQAMLSPDQVKGKIAQGKKLILAGDERLFRQLPEGDWIGGTIPYFMTEEGGQCTVDKFHVTELPDFVQGIDIRFYAPETIASVYADAPDHGVSFIIIPAKSPVHSYFALNAQNFANFAVRPLVGWISGVHLKEIGSRPPKVFNGRNADANESDAIVMHVTLPKGKIADIGILNIFVQGDGDSIVFPNDGFSTTQAYINGELRDFRDYLLEKKLDTRLPLVANFNGVSINTSMGDVEKIQEGVDFYAPVFSGLEYKQARPVHDYISKFVSQLPIGLEHQIAFSCNCILNYLYSNLEGKRIPGITGPATFGEIAYLLLNQTMVYVRIIDLPSQRQ